MTVSILLVGAGLVALGWAAGAIDAHTMPDGVRDLRERNARLLEESREVRSQLTIAAARLRAHRLTGCPAHPSITPGPPVRLGLVPDQRGGRTRA